MQLVPAVPDQHLPEGTLPPETLPSAQIWDLQLC